MIRQFYFKRMVIMIMIILFCFASVSCADIINGRSYWPLATGNYWVYRNVDNGYLTRIEVISQAPVPEGMEYIIRFTKNHASTYWGVGTNWWIDERFIDDGTKIWSPSYVLYKDGMETNQPTGSSTITMASTDPRYPPYLFLPNQIDLPQPIFYGLQYQSTEWGIGYGGWLLRYSIVGENFMWVGLLLRMQVDEPVWIPSIGKVVIYEDWYYWQGVGPVIIEQYADHNRTKRNIRIEMIEYKLY